MQIGLQKISPQIKSATSYTSNTASFLVTVIATTLSLICFSISAHAQVERIDGKPNLNGIWQVMNSANWNLEAHSATKLDDFWELGALASIPAGQSVIVNGSIPYLASALEKRAELQAGWPKSDPETLCYLPGIPRATYMPYPFQIFQGNGDILMAYSYTSANRTIHMGDYVEAPVDIWMGSSNGTWEGDTLVIETHGFNARAHLDRSGNHFSSSMTVTERFTLTNENVMWYEATLVDPETYSEPWTMRMPLYKHVEDNAQLLEHKCVPFAEELIYKDLELAQ